MTSSSSFWDDGDVRAAVARSTFAKFVQVGDRVEGTVAEISLRSWPDGGKSIEIHFQEDVPTVSAGQVLLQQHLYNLRPEAGDVLTIELTGLVESNNRTLKKWRVDRTRDGKTLTEKSA